MSSVVIAGNTSGTITLDAPNVAGTTVLTLPTANGTVITTATPFSNGQGPAFRAYLSANQSISSATFTKINIDTETFDTNSCFDTTNKRFTPTVAGYYQVNGVMRAYGTPSSFMQVLLYKNGTGYESGQLDEYANTNAGLQMTLSTLVYLNGTTDYIELWGYVSGTTPSYQYFNSLNTCWFSAALVRAA